MKRILRWIFRIAVLAVVLGIPTAAYGIPQSLKGDGADAVSGATSYVFSEDDIQGEYVILINKKLHREENLPLWKDFFTGKDVPVILEDISCFVANGDTPASDYAGICQARLPENQMKLRYESGILVASKAKYEKFDVIIMSKVIYDSYSLELENDKNIMAVQVQ